MYYHLYLLEFELWIVLMDTLIVHTSQRVYNMWNKICHIIAITSSWTLHFKWSIINQFMIYNLKFWFAQIHSIIQHIAVSGRSSRAQRGPMHQALPTADVCKTCIIVNIDSNFTGFLFGCRKKVLLPWQSLLWSYRESKKYDLSSENV